MRTEVYFVDGDCLTFPDQIMYEDIEYAFARGKQTIELKISEDENTTIVLSNIKYFKLKRGK